MGVGERDIDGGGGEVSRGLHGAISDRSSHKTRISVLFVLVANPES